ncbi:MAG: endonuclease/exonuclease/phosphatase family protein [Alistipes sp.]|nr:endonuclease/exonuclease/phosphatase family protein [Alistipes sp.]
MEVSKIFTLALMATASICCSTGNKGNELTVMSYNIRNCIGMDGVEDHARAAAVISAAAPDVVALQELDSATLRTASRDILGILAQMTGMYPTYGPAINFDDGKYGVGILSKEEPLSQRNIPLPGREEKRTLLVVEFRDFYLFNTHLSLTEQDRLSSVEIIRRARELCDKPVILAGDFNDVPGSATLEALSRHFTTVSNTSVGTFPAGSPEENIDYIMFHGSPADVEVVSSGLDSRTIASDHCPIWTKIRF